MKSSIFLLWCSVLVNLILIFILVGRSFTQQEKEQDETSHCYYIREAMKMEKTNEEQSESPSSESSMLKNTMNSFDML